MKFSRDVQLQLLRDAWVEVNLDALEANARGLRRFIPASVEMMAIVKADAYGHGAITMIPILQAYGVSMVGVAAMDEAIQIRQAGLKIPILVIGAIPDWAVQVAADYDVQLTVFEQHHLDSIRQAYARNGKPVHVHVKLDTGMTRIGIQPDDALAFIDQCQNDPAMVCEGIFTHLACTEDAQVSALQFERFQGVVQHLKKPVKRLHFANTGGALCYPHTHLDMVRIGKGFYGYMPLLAHPVDLTLIPVMRLKARIIHRQTVPAGTGVSYSHTFKTTRDSVIAVLPLGYADGVPRCLSNKMEVLVRGVRCPQVGRLTMDQMMIDVTDVPEVALGETVTLLGEEEGPGGNDSITLTDWATMAGTSEYELMCALRVRLPKVYTRA
jgi:alanine racemase